MMSFLLSICQGLFGLVEKKSICVVAMLSGELELYIIIIGWEWWDLLELDGVGMGLGVLFHLWLLFIFVLEGVGRISIVWGIDRLRFARMV